MAEAEAEAFQHVPDLEAGQEEEDEVFLDTTMFDEDDEWLEGALAAPQDEDDDPYYFVQARTTGGLPPGVTSWHIVCYAIATSLIVHVIGLVAVVLESHRQVV